MYGFFEKETELEKDGIRRQKAAMVNSLKHLGTILTDTVDDMGQDILEKRAQYIAKNNELTQEFHYEHPSTKFSQIIYSTQIFTVHLCGTCFPQLSKHSRKPGTRLLGQCCPCRLEPTLPSRYGNAS